MNTPTSNSPRLVCRLVRRWAAVAGNPEARFFGSNHLEHCPACAKFFAAAEALDFSLKRDAATCSAVVPAGLEERIARAVQRSSGAGVSPVRPTRTGMRRPGIFATLSLAGAAAAVALTVIFLREPSNPAEEIAGATTSPSATQGAGIKLVGSRLWDSLAPSESGLLGRNPLEEEAAAVYSDARSAMRFLAMNFLPTSTEDVQSRSSDDGTRI